MLVESIEITSILPCLADQSKIRFHARPSADLGPVLPYLNAALSRAIYHHAAPALTIMREYRTICLHPLFITGAKADDVDDALVIVDWLKDVINDTWARRGEITPSYARRERLTPLPVYKLLPGTNCRACDCPTCLAFAAEVAAERASILKCAPLLSAQFAEKRRELFRTLADAGYEIPSAFRASEDADGDAGPSG